MKPNPEQDADRTAFEKLDKLVGFLLGENEYMGLQFGDSVMHGRTQARFWWRTDLRKLHQAAKADSRVMEDEINTLNKENVYLVERINGLEAPIVKLLKERVEFLEANALAMRDVLEKVCGILESIAKRPDLPNPERDADWENCMKWSSYNAKQCLLIAAPYRKTEV